MKERIGDICTLKSGTTLKEELLIEDGTIPYVKVSDMNLIGNEKYIVSANSYAVSNINEKMLFPIGTVLFPKRGGAIGTNKKRIASRTVCADLNTMGVIPSERIRPLFLYYYFRNIDFGALYNGSSVPQINNSDIAPMEIELPPLEEQDIAVAQLEKVDCIIQKRVEELTKLDDLIKARFVEMFDSGNYPQVTISELVSGKVPSVKKCFNPDDVIKYIDIASIDNKRNVMTGYTEYVLSEAPSRAQQHIIKGDIVISTVRPNLRNVAITEYDDENLVASSGFCVLRASKCLPEYLLAIVCSDKFTNDMTKVVTGANYPAIKDSDVMNYIVSCPPVEAQRQFAVFVKQVDKSKSVIQKSLNETQLLFDSLMQDCFG